jgi:DNA transformation protein
MAPLLASPPPRLARKPRPVHHAGMTDRGFIEHLRELFTPHASFEARRMFGGWGVYLDGIMCGLVAEGQLYLKTDAQTRAEFEAAGCGPFVYTAQARPITMSYWSAPEDALESADAMRPWAQLAHAAARRVPVKRKPAAARKRTPRAP